MSKGMPSTVSLEPPDDIADPDAPRLALYHWLSWLQEEVVQALATSLPDSPDE